MSIYCNISECVFNAKLEEPHQRMYGRGYVPIGDTGKYLGQCSLGVLRVKANTVHTNQTKHVMPECASFSEDETLLTAMSDEPILSFCNEKRCLHYDTEKGCTLPDNVYVTWQQVNNVGKISYFPKCDSFSNRRISGHIDWSKSGAA